MPRMTTPGTKARKRKPRTCLRIGLSNNMARPVEMRNINVNKRNLLELATLTDSIMLTIPFAS